MAYHFPITTASVKVSTESVRSKKSCVSHSKEPVCPLNTERQDLTCHRTRDPFLPIVPSEQVCQPHPSGRIAPPTCSSALDRQHPHWIPTLRLLPRSWIELRAQARQVRLFRRGSRTGKVRQVLIGEGLGCAGRQNDVGFRRASRTSSSMWVRYR